MRHRNARTWFAAGLVTLLLAQGTPAKASEEGRRNTAIGLTAAAGILLASQREKAPGIVAGIGAGIAWKRYQDAVRERRECERRYGYRDDRWEVPGDRYDRHDSRCGCNQCRLDRHMRSCKRRNHNDCREVRVVLRAAGLEVHGNGWNCR